ncbi:MAG TPA: anthrone oxygenase family protein [Terriglobales bacterium]|nr:anthrone oxygenase family protein [Terriglobales bacterium]
MLADLLPGVTPFSLLALLSALGCALVAGVFLAFSSFVMAALGRLPAEQGLAAMQAINITVLNPLFLGLFFGTGLLSLGLIAGGISRWPTAGGLCLIAAGLLYVFGNLLVTMICNVPLNEVMAKIAPASPEGAVFWQRYLADWTLWNHLRTACTALAAILIMVALR